MSEIETLSLLFDSAWYLATYQDVAAANCDPLEHYLAFGYKERRNPNRFFDTDFYLTTYPDIVSCHLNPFVHYILYGASEGRLPRPSHQPPQPAIIFDIFLQDENKDLETELVEEEYSETELSQDIESTKEELVAPDLKEIIKKEAKPKTETSKKSVRKPAPQTKAAALAQKRKKAIKV
ncbi:MULTISPECIES: hypothetical protein [Commensalibacter]|uniref:Family 2 glycosyl transferase n=2 Tax=Commensalibacter TaxID=1079922 RepID=W7DYK0_9PROT|nr:MULTISPECIES: hypothetical protein [Commensalibacter]EUK17754.1 family 2 glycosyl transferase [Commensalibacter papalotli (ex Servin-Garciduenas et al. 2014)]CAI3944645.1 Glycosyltransferase involved in cell wall bisynthesis (RfaB) (PDB:2IV7) [Commensalibacter papalotli (ex Botero et al. 2024)]CAI3946233.1 Glycosyltransferase involved in cell wall bisynthesis (RfaB) (PDB:2IV7) [Commensalibacter papalotli (ex Botero et al. 2024)]